MTCACLFHSPDQRNTTVRPPQSQIFWQSSVFNFQILCNRIRTPQVFVGHLPSGLSLKSIFAGLFWSRVGPKVLPPKDCFFLSQIVWRKTTGTAPRSSSSSLGPGLGLRWPYSRPNQSQDNLHSSPWPMQHYG